MLATSAVSNNPENTQLWREVVGLLLEYARSIEGLTHPQHTHQVSQLLMLRDRTPEHVRQLELPDWVVERPQTQTLEAWFKLEYWHMQRLSAVSLWWSLAPPVQRQLQRLVNNARQAPATGW